MGKALLIMSVFFSSLVYGQGARSSVYDNVDGLIIVDSIACIDIFGGFAMGDGLGGRWINLGADMDFKEMSFSCMIRSTVDSGSWSINNSNTVVLKFNKRTLFFDVVKFDNCYFLILPAQRQQFVAELQLARIKLKDVKPFAFEGQMVSVNAIIGYSLSEKFYSKEVEDVSGS